MNKMLYKRIMIVFAVSDNPFCIKLGVIVPLSAEITKNPHKKKHSIEISTEYCAIYGERSLLERIYFRKLLHEDANAYRYVVWSSKFGIEHKKRNGSSPMVA